MPTYKHCVVPMCESTSHKYPQKVFFSVPRNEALRKKWCRIMKRTTWLYAKSASYVCEDHFDMPNDTENYMKVKLMGGTMYRKKDVFPHIFDCQKDCIVPGRPQSERTKRKAMVNELLLEHQQSTTDQSPIPEPSTSLLLHQGSKTVVEEQDLSPQEKQDNIPVEPTIRIKEEPADDYSTPSTSSGTSNEEFILPDADIPWTTTSTVEESQLTLSVTSLNSSNVPESSDGGQLKKKQRTNSSLITANASTPTDVTNYTAIRQQSQAINVVSTISSSNELCTNPFGIFGSYVADKLNSLDSVSSAYAQKAIERIILEAEMGKFLDQTTHDMKPSVVPSSI